MWKEAWALHREAIFVRRSLVKRSEPTPRCPELVPVVRRNSSGQGDYAFGLETSSNRYIDARLLSHILSHCGLIRGLWDYPAATLKRNTRHNHHRRPTNILGLFHHLRPSFFPSFLLHSLACSLSLGNIYEFMVNEQTEIFPHTS